MAGLLGEYAKGLLGFVSDPQSWKDMGRNAVGLLGAPLPSKQEEMAMALRRRMQGSVMRDYPSAETDLANSYREKMTNVALGMNPILQTVWHGSPHLFPPTKNNPLGEFDLSKVGTGEGAQAFGHGTYLTESRDLGKVYKRKLTAPDGTPVQNPDQSIQISIGRLQNQIDQLKASGDPNAQAMIRAYQNRINELDANGYLYKVDLPDDQIARMLDWDKPLSQQPKEVQKFFENHVAPIRQEMSKPAPRWGDLSAPTKYDPTGQELLALLRNRDANMTGLDNGLTAAISKSLYAAGIPGIRYLDGGSRGNGSIFQKFATKQEAVEYANRAGGTTVVQPRPGGFVVVGEPAKTSNFVVFDDKIPKILGRE